MNTELNKSSIDDWCQSHFLAKPSTWLNLAPQSTQIAHTPAGEAPLDTSDTGEGYFRRKDEPFGNCATNDENAIDESELIVVTQQCQLTIGRKLSER